MSNVLDPKRLDAVERSGLVDSDREAVFDELTRAAASLLQAPFAFMTAVDATRSFWKSTYGIDDATRFNNVEDSFCQYVIERREELIVGDAASDLVTKHNPSIDSMGVRAWAGCPVELDGQVLGTFCVVDQTTRTWTERDRKVLRGLADLASREIELRTRLRDEAAARDEAESEAARLHELLDMVRVSFLPPAMPEIAGIDLGAFFRTAGDGESLLGDFYDVFPIGGDRWGLVIGDVCGHGAEAARLTSLVRYSLRAAAVQHADPAAVIDLVDRAVRHDPIEHGRFATLCYLVLSGTPGDDRQVAVGYAHAGHPPALVVGTDGSIRYLDDAGGPPVGLAMATDETWSAGSFHLQPGERIVAYTDGATDCRHHESGDRLGEHGFELAVSAAASAATCDDLVSDIAAHIGRFARVLSDDVAVVAVGV